ncbi:5,10-methylene-tetrahydrofolate dehydrogenase [Nosocomiicoccus ampullae]|uniref:5,10-methylene-tetrahydrofolate dehydrogenase n=1 Tax=Nosocomiicoccus ampullae TaxID=489910 RepID=A0A9Q2CY65_9STAP|nr:5,10-methylene-tetrahydrofolate dehydrogenase [Nosocomiicoccus ampullae]MBB5175365.1 hypothetical protein [Nosocomiicoccus ampullae]QYA46266.1 5,10-methylene-tetrahydrofolate dehydrogenase [Nosocomiicoccus ampullae]
MKKQEVNIIKLGIVTTPNEQTQLLLDDLADLENKLSNKLNKNVKIDYKIDPVIGTSEDIENGRPKLEKIRKENNWDYLINITDLPYIEKGKTLKYLLKDNIMTIFIPALGFFNLKNKQLSMLEDFLKNDILNKENPTTNRLKLIIGMTLLNKPWKGVGNFKTIISLAFATGTYISIFSMPWELSVVYSKTRLTILSLLAIIGMIIWLIYAHKLWEKKSRVTDEKYRSIYNLTTFFTLLITTVIIYSINVILLTVSISLFVPIELFFESTSANKDSIISYSLRLVWFVASLTILAGAFGSTVEDENKIRFITYSYRQNYRYNMIKKEQEEQDND